MGRWSYVAPWPSHLNPCSGERTKRFPYPDIKSLCCLSNPNQTKLIRPDLIEQNNTQVILRGRKQERNHMTGLKYAAGMVFSISGEGVTTWWAFSGVGSELVLPPKHPRLLEHMVSHSSLFLEEAGC